MIVLARICVVSVFLVLCLWIVEARGQTSGWTGAKLKNNSVSYGQIASGGSALTVEGKFTDTARVYQVLEEQGQFVKISDGVKSGWVFRLNLEPANDSAPATPDLERAPSTTRDPLLGQKVFWKDSGVAMLNNQVVDKSKYVHWPATVGDVNGEWLWLGRAWMKRSDVMLLDEAFDYYVNEVRRNPQSANAWHSRAGCWKEKGEIENAIRDYDEAIRLDPKSASAYNSRGNAKSAKQDFDGAIRDCDEAIRLDPKYANAYFSRGYAKYDKQDYDGAIRDYDEAIRLDPKDADAYNNRGVAKYNKQDYDGAIRDYDEAIRLDPKNEFAYNNRGFVKNNKEDYDGAIRDYDEAIRLDPKYALAYNNRGNAKKNKQDYDGAIRDYDEAIRLDPKNSLPLYNLGILLLIIREPEAADGFQKTIDVAGWQNERSTYATIFGCLAARLQGNSERAQKFLDDSAGKLKRDWPYPNIDFLRGDMNEADLLTQATDQDKQTEARCFIALDQLATGRESEARAHFEWIRDNGTLSYVQYDIALAELRRFDPNWTAPQISDRSLITAALSRQGGPRTEPTPTGQTAPASSAAAPPSPPRDPMLGQKVFFKDSGVAMLNDKAVDKFEYVNWPATVGDVNGEWLWLGRAWMKRSDVMLVDEAFDYYVDEVRRNPQAAIAWQRRAGCWVEKGEIENAIRDYDEAIRLDPKDAIYYNSRGNAKYNKQDYDDAIRDYDEAIRLDPKYAPVYNNRGNAKKDKQDYDGAIRDYDEAIRLDPKYAPVYNNRGNAKKDKQDYDGAIRDYDEAIRLDPKRASAYYNRGQAKYGKKDYDDAIRDYAEAIRLNPKSSDYFHNRGAAKFEILDYRGAISDFEEAIRLNPKDAWPYVGRAVTKYRQHDYIGVVHDCDEAIRLDPKLSIGWRHRAVAKSLLEDHDGASRDIEEAIRLDPKDAYLYNARAITKVARLDLDGAIRDFDEAIRLDPQNTFYNNRGKAKFAKQDYDGASRDFEEAIRINPKDRWANNNRGLLKLVLRAPDAAEAYRQALNAAGWKGAKGTEAVIMGCLAARIQGDNTLAQQFLDDATGKLDPEWPFPAIAFLRRERTETELLESATDKYKQMEARLFVALDHLAAGRETEAREHLEWIRDHGAKSYDTYHDALSELRRLDQ